MSVSVEELCSHLEIEDGVCQKCGVETSINGMYFDTSSDINGNYCHKNNKIFTYETDLSKLFLPDDVKIEVIKLCDITNSITRQSPRIRTLFALIYVAYLKLNLPLNPQELAKLVGLSPEDYNEALKLVSGLNSSGISYSSNITIPIVILSPLNYLKDVLANLSVHYPKVTFDYNEHYNLLELAIKKRPILLESKPMSICVGLIKYLLDKKNIKLSKFHEKVSISASVIKNSVKEIEMAFKN